MTLSQNAKRRFGVAVSLAAVLAAVTTAHAEQVRIGVLKTSASGAVFIAQEKGFFAEEELQPRIVFFDASQPVAVAAVSGEVDFGATGLTGAFYALATQNALRIIGGNQREEPGFQTQAITISNAAQATGLKTFRDLGGRSFAASVVGSPAHYSLALLAQRYSIDLKSIRILQLQSIPNIIAAVIGGQADFTILPSTAGLPSIQKGGMKLLGWLGDETPFQLGAVYTATKTADGRAETVNHFLRALRKGMRAYHDAFAGDDNRRRDGPSALEMNSIIAKYVEQTPEQVAQGIAYLDADARIDSEDVARQIRWYEEQGMIKGRVEADTLIDKRYALGLPPPR
jgi:NitT/TauT family transport system substrate-binding protein